MPNRAIEILFDTYWSPVGWRTGTDRIIAPEDFGYAKLAGVMFDPIKLSHTQILKNAVAAVNALTPKDVADGFLASLSTRRLDLRSALGSFAVLRFLPQHAYTPENGQCAICGSYGDGEEPDDLNVLNFERLKWGGVRHDRPLYASFDLEQFLKADRPNPSATDVRIFLELIRVICDVPQDTSAAHLSKYLSTIGIKSNKAERDVIVGILGLCGMLGTTAHPGYFRRFVPCSERELPPRRFVDMHYPACWWRGSDGINRDALSLYFGHVL